MHKRARNHKLMVKQDQIIKCGLGSYKEFKRYEPQGKRLN